MSAVYTVKSKRTNGRLAIARENPQWWLTPKPKMPSPTQLNYLRLNLGVPEEDVKWLNKGQADELIDILKPHL